MKYRQLFLEKAVGGAGGGQYTWIEEPTGRADGDCRRADDRCHGLELFRLDNSRRHRRVRGAGRGCFPVELDGRTFTPPCKGRLEDERGRDGSACWRPIDCTRSATRCRYVRYIDDFPAFPLTNVCGPTRWHPELRPIQGLRRPDQLRKVVERCMLMTTDPGDLVLDPTCGPARRRTWPSSGGGGGSRSTPVRVALALARTRLMCARFPYYLLADSPRARPRRRS